MHKSVGSMRFLLPASLVVLVGLGREGVLARDTARRVNRLPNHSQIFDSHSDPIPADTVLFAIPVGDMGVTYAGVDVNEMLDTGPSALAVSASGDFWVLDPEGRRVLNYDRQGKRLGHIDFPSGVVGARDIEVDTSGVWILDVASVTPKVVHIGFNGHETSRIDLSYSLGETRGSGLVMDGADILHVQKDGQVSGYVEIQHKPVGGLGAFSERQTAILVPSNVMRSRASSSEIRLDAETARLSIGKNSISLLEAGEIGGARLLSMTPDGTTFVLVERVSPTGPKISVQQAVYAVDHDGSLLAEYRTPLDEQLMFVENPIAISSAGEVFALVTRQSAIEIRRLNPRIPQSITSTAPL